MAEVGGYGNPGGMDAQIATVRAIYDAFARDDVEAALEHIAEDVELRPQGTAEMIGREAPYRGHDGMRQYVADAARVWDELTLHADDVRATAGGVVVFGHVSGRSGGAHVRRRVVWLWRLRGGKAVSIRVDDVGPLEAA